MNPDCMPTIGSVWPTLQVKIVRRKKGHRYRPSAAADRRIRRRKLVRRKSAGKIMARRISRRILLAENPPEIPPTAEFFFAFLLLFTIMRYLFLCMFSAYKLVLCGS